jgi:Rrf2 family protein
MRAASRYHPEDAKERGKPRHRGGPTKIFSDSNMKIARETDYAVRCLLFMARSPLAIHTVGEIAESQKIPSCFLAKILQKLVRAGLLSSSRGVRGGFRFRRNPRDVTLLSAIEAVEGPLALDGRRVEGAAHPGSPGSPPTRSGKISSGTWPGRWPGIRSRTW